MTGRGAAALLLAGLAIAPMAGQAEVQGGGRSLATSRAVGDAITEPLDGLVGDAARGRRIVLDRRVGNCLICHAVPERAEAFQGELGPDLSGVGSRLTAGQIRLRLVDPTRLNPASIMPAYHRVSGLRRVAAEYAGRPVLTAQEIEDVVAYLVTLKDG